MKEHIFDFMCVLIVVVVGYLLIPSGLKQTDIAESYNNMTTRDVISASSKSEFYSNYTESISIQIIDGEMNATNNNSNTTNSTGSQYVIDENVSADIDNLLQMSEKEFWEYVTNGKFSNYADASAYRNLAYWESLQESITIPIWKWDSKNNTKVQGETVIRVNKYVKNIFLAAFTDIFNSDEKPIIVHSGAFEYKVKEAGGLSAHAFGLAIDLNVGWNPCYYSYSYIVGGKDKYGVRGAVVTKDMYNNANVDDETKRMVIYQGGTVATVLVEKYLFKWGATFGYKSSGGGGDRMHFSLLGDGPWRDKALEYRKNNDWDSYYKRGVVK